MRQGFRSALTAARTAAFAAAISLIAAVPSAAQTVLVVENADGETFAADRFASQTTGLTILSEGPSQIAARSDFGDVDVVYFPCQTFAAVGSAAQSNAELQAAMTKGRVVVAGLRASDDSVEPAAGLFLQDAIAWISGAGPTGVLALCGGFDNFGYLPFPGVRASSSGLSNADFGFTFPKHPIFANTTDDDGPNGLLSWKPFGSSSGVWKLAAPPGIDYTDDGFEPVAQHVRNAIVLVADFSPCGQTILDRCTRGDGAQRLTAPDGQTADCFGWSVALEGTTLAIGSPFDDTPGEDAGSVYIYERTLAGWTLTQRLQASSPVAFEKFGISSALQGDTLVVGARGNFRPATHGAAYVFERTPGGWVQRQRLTGLSPDPKDDFGLDVALDGDVIVVGAFNDSTIGRLGGALYVFRKSGGIYALEQQITSGDLDSYRWFGTSVALEGDVLAVRATQRAPDFRGTVWILRHGPAGWQIEQILVSDELFTSFGNALSLQGDELIIGDSSSEFISDRAGGVFVYEWTGTTWVETQRLSPADLQSADSFGRSLARSGDTLAVGTVRDTVYVYKRDPSGASGWSEARKIGDNEPEVDRLFGGPVAIVEGVAPSAPEAGGGADVVLECSEPGGAVVNLSTVGASVPLAPGGDTIITGAVNDNELGTEAGAVYVFEDSGVLEWTAPGATLGTSTCEGTAGLFPPGTTPVTWTVRNGPFEDSASFDVTVVDTAPPFGAITYPRPGQCLGPASLPVTIRDEYADCCDGTDIAREYDPPPGPSYDAHGDLSVGMTVRDRAGLETTSGRVDFTIDRVAPVVATVPRPVPEPGLPPGSIAFADLYSAHDDDGAAGEVLNEAAFWDDCAVFNGIDYGNGDGFLLDESVPFGTGPDGVLCRAFTRCGTSVWIDPVFRFAATDCGGNVGTAEIVYSGSFRIDPATCGIPKPLIHEVIDTITVGAAPRGVGINPFTNRVFVASEDSDTLSIIDGHTNAIVNQVSFAVVGHPAEVAVNPMTDRVYVANAGSFRRIAVIDGTTGEVVGHIPTDWQVVGLAVNPRTNRIYYTDFARNQLTVVDGATLEKIATVFVFRGFGVAVNPRTNVIYVTADRETLYKIDGETNTVFRVLETAFESPHVAVNPVTGKVYSSSIRSLTLTINDEAAPSVKRLVFDRAAPRVVDFNTRTGRVYVGVWTSFGAEIAILDAVTDELIGKISDPRFNNTWGLAVHPTTGRIYMADPEGDSLYVIQGPDGVGTLAPTPAP